VRGNAINTKYAQRGRQRQVRLINTIINRAYIDCCVILPAEHASHPRARRPLRILGSDDFACGKRTHDFTDTYGLRVIGHRIHPAAHGRLDGEKVIAYQHLARMRLRHGGLHKSKVFGLRNALGTAGENHLTVHESGHDFIV